MLWSVCPSWDNYFQSAEQYLEMGKFGIPAKHHEAIALIYSKVRSSALLLTRTHLITLVRRSIPWTTRWFSTTSVWRLTTTTTITGTPPGTNAVWSWLVFTPAWRIIRKLFRSMKSWATMPWRAGYWSTVLTSTFSEQGSVTWLSTGKWKSSWVFFLSWLYFPPALTAKSPLKNT